MENITEKDFDEEREVSFSRKTHLTLEIAGSAIFGALSIVFSLFITPIIPRIEGWGIAIIDPISIIWMICFLIFGVRAGLSCCIIGTFGLMWVDPFTPIGPMMKFAATVPLIIVPAIFLKLSRRVKNTHKSSILKEVKNYALCGFLGVLIRIGLMLLFNIWIFLTIFAGFLNYTNLGFIGLPDVSGWTAIFLGVIIINAETSLWDLLIPYLVVFSTRLNEKFFIW